MLFLVCTNLFGNDSNSITIRERRPRIKYLRGASQGFEVRPDRGPNRTLEQSYQEFPSIQRIDNGHIKASGFDLPRIRGQDPRSTELFIDGILISNPYTGLPFIDQLDLKAFDLLTFYQGVSDVDLASTNPIGAVSLSFKPQTKPSYALGSQSGKPYGQSYWFLIKERTRNLEITNTLDYRLYFRQHHTSGKYSYYNDSGTPYNRTDDSIDQRQDNTASSALVLQYFSMKSAKNQFTLLSLLDRGDYGIPAQVGTGRTHANRTTQHSINSINSRHPVIENHLDLNLNLTLENSKQNTLDPLGKINPRITNSHLNLQGLNSTISIKVQISDSSKINLDYTHADSKINLNGDVFMRRTLRKLYLGASHTKWQDRSSTQLKFIHEDISDKVRSADENFAPTPPYSRNNFTLAQHLTIIPRFLTIHAQWGHRHRAPSLLELFGDGYSLRENSHLKPEKMLHHELGINIITDNHQVSLTYFCDNTTDKIIFLPSSHLSSGTSENLDRTRIQGLEVMTQNIWTRWLHSNVNYSRLYPVDKSDAASRKQLPHLATNNLILRHDVITPRGTFSVLNSYRSSTYLDARNTISSAPLWLHDLSYFYEPKYESISFEFSFSIKNILDQKHTDIKSTSGESGRVAANDFLGYPLPGRRWELAASLRF